ncbi:MAG: TolC family protein [Thermoanaerobaculia bacterium]|nr:TolC family protein [Thermoanaerobaculia bacterium]
MRQAREQAREVAAARARQEAADARVSQAKAYRLPQLRLQEIYARTDSPAEAFAFQLNQERFSFPEFVSGDPNDPDALSTAITRLELEVPIWTGGELSKRAAQAGLAAEAAAISSGWTSDQAAVAAAEAYVRLAQVREQVALLEKARGTVAAHVDLARAYSAQGMLVRSELLRAEVELARMDDLLAEARGHGRVAEANLAFRLADPLGTSYELAPLPDPADLAEGREGWIASAAGRRDLEAARTLLAAGELEAEALKGGLFPRIGLVARHDLVDDSLFGTHGDSTTVMAMASIDLVDLFPSGRRRSAIAAARAEAEAGRQDVARFEEGVRLEVKQAYEQAQVALERRATAERALSAAEEAVRILEERFRAGVVKTLDLLDAVTARREAEMRELVARAEAHLAAIHLAVRAGRAPESVLSDRDNLAIAEGGKQ